LQLEVATFGVADALAGMRAHQKMAEFFIPPPESFGFWLGGSSFF